MTDNQQLRELGKLIIESLKNKDFSIGELDAKLRQFYDVHEHEHPTPELPPEGYKEIAFDCICGGQHRVLFSLIPVSQDGDRTIFDLGIEMQFFNAGYVNMRLNEAQIAALADFMDGT